MCCIYMSPQLWWMSMIANHSEYDCKAHSAVCWECLKPWTKWFWDNLFMFHSQHQCRRFRWKATGMPSSPCPFCVSSEIIAGDHSMQVWTERRHSRSPLQRLRANATMAPSQISTTTTIIHVCSIMNTWTVWPLGQAQCLMQALQS